MEISRIISRIGKDLSNGDHRHKRMTTLIIEMGRVCR